MAVTAPSTLVLRYADVGVAVYASLRIVGVPGSTVTWVIENAELTALGDLLADAVDGLAGADDAGLGQPGA